jgi:hypothetical protein
MESLERIPNGDEPIHYEAEGNEFPGYRERVGEA